MPRSKQQDLALAKRRQEVASLYLQQRTMRQIAQQVGASHGTVCNDVNALEAHWRELAIEDIRSAKGRQLAKLRLMEREAWEQWQRSKKDIERQTTMQETSDKDGAKMRATLLKEARLADDRYQGRVAWCMEQEAKLLGLYVTPPKDGEMPTPPAAGVSRSTLDLSKLTLDDISMLRDLRRRLKERAAQGAATAPAAQPARWAAARPAGP
jgi:hypothetical protein